MVIIDSYIYYKNSSIPRGKIVQASENLIIVCLDNSRGISPCDKEKQKIVDLLNTEKNITWGDL